MHGATIKIAPISFTAVVLYLSLDYSKEFSHLVLSLLVFVPRRLKSSYRLLGFCAISQFKYPYSCGRRYRFKVYCTDLLHCFVNTSQNNNV